MREGWSVLELATQYNVSKQIIFNYINEMERNRINGFTKEKNQFLINQTGFNYILERRENIKESIKKTIPEKPITIEPNTNLEIDNAILKSKVEYLEERVKDLEEQRKRLQYDLEKKDNDLKESQASYKELTNKTIGLFLPSGTTEPKKKKHWWNRN